MMIKIELPCSPLVKHYLESNFGKPVHLTKRSLAGKFFFRILSRPYHKNNKKYSGYKEKTTIHISEDTLLRYGCELSLNDIMEFNQFVTKQVYGLMFVTLQVLEDTMPDFNLEKGVLFFADKFNFPPDAMTLSAAVKAYYRYKNTESIDLQVKKSFGETVRR